MSYLIVFRRTAQSTKKLIELPTEESLLHWFARTGCKCVEVRIRRIKEDDET